MPVWQRMKQIFGLETGRWRQEAGMTLSPPVCFNATSLLSISQQLSLQDLFLLRVLIIPGQMFLDWGQKMFVLVLGANWQSSEVRPVPHPNGGCFLRCGGFKTVLLHTRPFSDANFIQKPFLELHVLFFVLKEWNSFISTAGSQAGFINLKLWDHSKISWNQLIGVLSKTVRISQPIKYWLSPSVNQSIQSWLSLSQ